LSPTRERWPQWTVERFRTPGVDLLRESSAPPIPAPGDDLYHGERIDLSTADVGAHLEQQTGRLGPRVVVHLFRSDANKITPTRPIRIKGADLVLFFEPQKPAVKGAPVGRVVLQGDGAGGVAMIEVDNGNLDVIGGEAPLFDCRVKPGVYVQLFLLRSTVVARGTAVRVADDDAVLPLDTFRCLAWDALLSHAGPEPGGALLELPARIRHDAARWQGVNSLYAGWDRLLRGPRALGGVDLSGWEKYWDHFDLERDEPGPWPARTFP